MTSPLAQAKADRDREFAGERARSNHQELAEGALVRVDNLVAGYVPGVDILDGCDLHCAEGELVGIIGPNGAGKSTLLRSLLGLQPPLAGRIELSGLDLLGLSPGERARRSAVVLTDRIEAGLLTGREVAELGRHPHHRLVAGRLSRAEAMLVEETLERMHAAELARKKFAELSDGQRQRILLARALVQQPELLVLDEPSAYLDVGARVELLALLGEVAQERGIVVLISTHEVELALRMADQLFLLDRGRLRFGTPATLIIDGSIGAVFGTRRTRFDPTSRSFVLRR